MWQVSIQTGIEKMQGLRGQEHQSWVRHTAGSNIAVATLTLLLSPIILSGYCYGIY